jgi:bifunctional DNase/RNase
LTGTPEYRLGSADAIALALHMGIPIHAENTVLDAAAVACTAFRAECDDRTPD